MVDKTPAQITPGNANDNSVVHASDASLSDLSRSHTERDISRLQGTAPLFQVTQTYIVNDLVTESNVVYRNIVAIPVPGAFNPTDWQAIQTPWTSDIDADGFSLLDSNYLEQREITEPTTPAAGLVRLWSEADSGLSLIRYKGSDGQVNTLLQDDLVIARNTTGVTILEGSVVYFTGSNGNKITIDLAKADKSATMPSIGFALQDIPNNTNGTVMLRGRVSNIDTSAFSAGDILYVSETTAGGVTNVKPTHPNLAQVVGVVTVSNPTTGEIDVILGSLQGDELGTNSNTFKIGDGLAGTKTLALTDDVGDQTLTSDSAGMQINVKTAGTLSLFVGATEKITATDSLVTLNNLNMFLNGGYADWEEITEPAAPASTDVGRFWMDPSTVINDHPRLILKDSTDVNFDCSSAGMVVNTYNTEAIGNNHYLALSGLNTSNGTFQNRAVIIPRSCRFYNMYVVVTQNGTTIVTNIALNDGAASPTVLDIDIPIGTTGTFVNSDDFVDLNVATEVAYGFGLTTGGTLAVASVGMAMDVLRLT